MTDAEKYLRIFKHIGIDGLRYEEEQMGVYYESTPLEPMYEDFAHDIITIRGIQWLSRHDWEIATKDGGIVATKTYERLTTGNRSYTLSFDRLLDALYPLCLSEGKVQKEHQNELP